MFTGRDYHHAFEEARDELAGRLLDRDEVLGKLVGLEWTLWEAMRGAMLLTGSIAGLIVTVPISYLVSQSGNSGWPIMALLFALWLAIAVGLYWIFRFVVYVEITRHVKGRRFGDLDFPWVPGSSNYDPVKYPPQA